MSATCRPASGPQAAPPSSRRPGSSAFWPNATSRSARSPPTAWAAGRPCSPNPPRPVNWSGWPRSRPRRESPSSCSGRVRTSSSRTPGSPACAYGSPTASSGSRSTADLVRAGGAAAYPVLARQSAAAGLTGLEWAVGIPGSVGGAVRMNAGGHGAETSDRLVACRIVSLEGGGERVVPATELDLSYRHSSVRAGDVVIEATYRLEPGDAAASADRIRDIVRWRREHQPGGQNAGSVFTNPPDDAAGRLVEAAGLKGLRIGSAAVSEKHANFIQADPDGSADDVRRVIDEVRAVVLARLGVELRDRAAARRIPGGAMTDPRIHERHVRVQRQRGHRRLGILLGMVLAGGLAAGGAGDPAHVVVRRPDRRHRRGGAHRQETDSRHDRPEPRAAAHRRRHHDDGAAGSTGCRGWRRLS